ncbi:bicaudal D-related protein homolog [Ischnura elegans]|uniref:bicaudal D-related protein homolog n=1 Tax=Ischnura elegans TaxID=197161 RepID=UPI001ED894F6|nr:bicaudal D-related protein homolog [Ischnura elegans]
MSYCGRYTSPVAMMKPKYELEDYIFEMESRRLGHESDAGGAAAGADSEDLLSQLARKEQDLILAAELGKALLERNQEMAKQNERTVEEFSQKLEALEQEKHSLKRRLESMQSEYDIKVLEMQSDIKEMRVSLDEREVALKTCEREKALIISDLTEQNRRLTDRIREATKAEEQLSAQIQGLRDQSNLRKTSLQDHVAHLEMLKEEITLITERKNDLERKVQQLLDERESLTSALEESADRIVMLEKQQKEQDIQFRQTAREVEELRATNGSLTERIDALSPASSTPSSSSSSAGHRSLLNEMEVSDASFTNLHHQNSSDIECDDDMDSSSGHTPELRALQDEVLSSCKELRIVNERLRRGVQWDSGVSNSNTSLTSSIDDDQVGSEKIRAGLLRSVVQELKDTLRLNEQNGVCPNCGTGPEQVERLETELHRAKEASDKAQRQLRDALDELKKRGDESMQLTSQLSVAETKLRATEEERDVARADADSSAHAKEESVAKAWEMRDKALARKNAAEVELARTRIDLLQINSQLIEAIQQKVELSQQLEQWQMDMHLLLDEQMKKKLTTQEQRHSKIQQQPQQKHRRKSSRGQESDSEPNDKRQNSRLFGLFTR